VTVTEADFLAAADGITPAACRAAGGAASGVPLPPPLAPVLGPALAGALVGAVMPRFPPAAACIALAAPPRPGKDSAAGERGVRMCVGGRRGYEGEGGQGGVCVC
jgi:hypothetical protein